MREIYDLLLARYYNIYNNIKFTTFNITKKNCKLLVYNIELTKYAL